jgi:hypothetical protein
MWDRPTMDFAALNPSYMPDLASFPLAQFLLACLVAGAFRLKSLRPYRGALQTTV